MKSARQGKKAKADMSGEEKIREAARRVFTRKGYAATRTRDIAEEAGMNLALLNYYYRSKEKLFHLVMAEKIQILFGSIVPVMTDPDTGLESKIEKLVDKYLDLLLVEPDIPIFVLSEIRAHPQQFKKKMNLEKLLRESSLVKQLRQRRPDLHPLHFLMNILSLMVFPFVSRPIMFGSSTHDNIQFAAMMAERKKLIPEWVGAMLKQ